MFGLFRKKEKLIPLAEVEVIPVLDSVVAEGSGMRFLIGNAQHQGQRDYQEDSFGVSDTSQTAIDQKGLMAVLADGMGGLSNGKEISQKAVSNILGWFASSATLCNDAETMKSVVIAMNDELCSAFGNDCGMKSGTTLVTALIKEGFLHWLCVGDSRLFLKRGDRLYQMNEDHDYLNQLLDGVIDGDINLSKVFSDPQKDSLAVCIGKKDLDLFDYSKQGFRLEYGDILVLCSDGVYNALSMDEMIDNITGEPMTDAERIKQTILSKGIPHQDNNTIIIVKYNTKG